MNTTFTSIRIFFERNGFNVSTRLAERLGLRVKYVRLFFIYIGFIFGAGFGLYFAFAFALKIKDLIRRKRSSVFDL